MTLLQNESIELDAWDWTGDKTSTWNADMKTLMERVGGFAQKKPTPVKRGGASYDATYKFCVRGLKLCV
jgi:hypothetical protein